jgi:heat shock protein HslJ
MNKLILGLIAVLFVISSCTVTEKISSNDNQIWWISGVKTECSGVAEKMKCLNIYKGKDINNPTWENFYPNIEGFEFEEGYLKKIEVKTEKLEPKDVPAYASSIKYTLVKELEKIVDYRMNINGKWILSRLNDTLIDNSITSLTMEIDLEQKRVMGRESCKGYFGSILNITFKTIQFGTITRTKRPCPDYSREREYHKALNKVTNYQIKGSNLIFYSNGKKVLSFTKNKEANQRLHDIWVAIRIDGNEVDRKITVPRLEINLTKNKIYGNDGCNEYSGSIDEVSDTQLKFGALAATKKMCRNMEVVNKFNKAMSKVISYKLEGMNLILMDNEGKEILALLKVD